MGLLQKINGYHHYSLSLTLVWQRRLSFIFAGGNPRRDEALLFEQLLKKEDVDTKKYVYSGLPHGFWTTCPDLDVSKTWGQDLIEGGSVSFLK